MKKILFIFIAIMFVYTSPGNAQRCKADDLLQKSLERDSGLRGYISRLETMIKEWTQKFPFHPTLHHSSITIPVVVHIVYHDTTEYIRDDQIQSQIIALNRDYQKLNLNEINRAPAAYKAIAAKTYLKFELAKRKPDGTATNGITRRRTTKSEFVFDNALDCEKVKQATDGTVAWDTDKYLNIWVCDLWDHNGTNPVNSLLGYATFPADTNMIQGVAIDYTCFGTKGTAQSPYHFGRTTTHEIGHYLDLYHTFQGGCLDQDSVADTPPQRDDSGGCTAAAGCPGITDPVMFMNYMDYTDDSCMYMFTVGQRKRMLGHFIPGGRRAGLAVSDALLPPNVTTINYQVFLESQNSQLPSWKAAMVMIHAWACQCTPDVDAMVRDNAGQPGRHIAGIPNDISEVIHALALTPEEINMCYSAVGFYGLLQDGPIALLSADTNESYGLVISGMSFDPNTGEARLSIKDPMGIGPRGFFMVNQTGSEYTVSYREFMINILERMASNNRKVYIVYPPSATAAVRFP